MSMKRLVPAGSRHSGREGRGREAIDCTKVRHMADGAQVPGMHVRTQGSNNEST